MIWFLSDVFAANPSFEVNPWSWTNLKLHCRYLFNVKLNAWWQSYNWFDHVLKFDSWEVNIIHSWVNTFFASSPDWYIRSWYLYRAYWAATTGKTTDINLTDFIFYSISNVWSTILNFTNCNWWAITFGSGTTADCAVVNWYTVWWLDILAWINDASYNFSPLPCVPDWTPPTIWAANVTPWQTQIPSNQVISMLINDWAWAGVVNWPLPLESNNKSHYRYWWLSPILSNYVAAPATVDNQEWVNSWSIRITVTAPSYWAYWTYVLSWSSLSLSDFAWDAGKNQYTRDSEIRWYNVSFDPPSPYPIEKQISISITATDRPNESWLTHTSTSSFTFNAPQAPTITMLSPSPTTFVNPSLTEIRFYITDDRAWVDTWTVKFTIPAISSWWIFMTWYTYSWSDLTFVLSWWSAWIWNGWDYVVSFTPKWDFPANSTVQLTWVATDLAWTTRTSSFSFSTRPDCAYFGCSTILRIHIPWLEVFEFSWSLLMVSWTGYGYSTSMPYLSGNTLVCSLDYTWAILTWNVNITSSTWVSVNWILYKNNNIYITWLEFSYQNWVVVIPD